jgi:hypothetical protein
MEPAHEADHAPSSAEVENASSYISATQCALTARINTLPFFLHYFVPFILTVQGHHKLYKYKQSKIQNSSPQPTYQATETYRV